MLEIINKNEKLASKEGGNTANDRFCDKKA